MRPRRVHQSARAWARSRPRAWRDLSLGDVVVVSLGRDGDGVVLTGDEDGEKEAELL